MLLPIVFIALQFTLEAYCMNCGIPEIHGGL